MSDMYVDFSTITGPVKPMHAVNNGPVGGGVRAQRGTAPYFAQAGIPYARTHDSAFANVYGGEWTVDVHRIFRNFDADPTDPASYDFETTDGYVNNTFSVGTEIYYRLGSCIEHKKKYGTFPPKDFHKWAVICEHIIRHYTEGWANGFHHPIRYWEIWNEPDCHNGDGSNPCWQGTDEQFFELFAVAARHLKDCFPQLKIGGPAIAWIGSPMVKPLFAYLQQHQVPLDFFSFHCYAKTPTSVARDTRITAELCREHGYGDIELHLNEWNYIRGWTSDDFDYSKRTIKGLKGASFTTAVMCVGQASELDMLMYYDARPCSFNGLFDTDFYDPLKGYYPFKMFGSLYRMGHSVSTSVGADDTLYATAAVGDDVCGVMFTHYAEDDATPKKQVTVHLNGWIGDTITVYRLDETHDMEVVETIPACDSITLDVPLHSVIYLTSENT